MNICSFKSMAVSLPAFRSMLHVQKQEGLGTRLLLISKSDFVLWLDAVTCVFMYVAMELFMNGTFRLVHV